MGNPDLWDRGLACFWGFFFCGLFTPIYQLPGHRFVPESHKIILFVYSIFLVSFSFCYIIFSIWVIILNKIKMVFVKLFVILFENVYIDISIF